MIFEAFAALVFGCRSDDVIIDRIAILTLIEFLPHHIVEIAAPEVEDFAKRFAEVAIESGINNRIEETVAVAKPEEQTRKRLRNSLRVAEKRPDECKNKKWQPTDGKRGHNDAKSGAGFSFFGQLKPELFLMWRAGHAVQMIPDDR